MKVTQRVPVRILVVDRDLAFPLHVQTSTTVTVNTGEEDQPSGLARDVTLSEAQVRQIAERKGLVSHATASAQTR